MIIVQWSHYFILLWFSFVVPMTTNRLSDDDIIGALYSPSVVQTNVKEKLWMQCNNGLSANRHNELLALLCTHSANTKKNGNQKIMSTAENERKAISICTLVETTLTLLWALVAEPLCGAGALFIRADGLFEFTTKLITRLLRGACVKASYAIHSASIETSDAARLL